jgi:hypothetical protein
MEEQRYFLLTPHLIAYECGQNKEIWPEMYAFELGSSYIVPHLEHSYAKKWASYYEHLRCIYLIREGEVPLQSPFIPSVVITPRTVPSITEE